MQKVAVTGLVVRKGKSSLRMESYSVPCHAFRPIFGFSVLARIRGQMEFKNFCIFSWFF
jgi:hypothetical protein